MSSEHNVSYIFRDYLAVLDILTSLLILRDEEKPGHADLAVETEFSAEGLVGLAEQLNLLADIEKLNHLFLEHVTDPAACWQQQFLPDVVSCDGWLEGQSDITPEHMCWRKYVHSINLLFGFHPSWPWPVGIGRRSFSVWRDHIEDGARIPESDISAILRVNRGFQSEKPDSVFVPDLPGFLVARDDVWLGLVAARDLPAGQVYLLGLVVNCAEDESEFWRPGSWKWTDALLVIQPLADKGLASLTDTGKTLLTWYNKVLLGEPVLGRPVGSKEYWSGKADFVGAVRTAIKALLAADKGITQERVHEYLAGNMTRVARSHGQGDYRFDQFKRDRKDYGFPSWEDLRDFCIN